MAGQVAVQADISALGIRGLGAFSALLEAFSKDNVAPAAVIQMENLGAHFLISGKFAEKVPDSMQRHSNTSLGRVAVSVGWHKGDTAALLAASAGGQAIGLLSLCLHNLYGADKAGKILYDLSRNSLPSNIANSSIAQLSDVAKLLHNKLAMLGFGNELARQVIRIHSAFTALGIEAPKDLLEPLTAESTVELLQGISTALRDQNKVLRIKGTYGLESVMGLITTLFQEDCLVTVHDMVIQAGIRANIVLSFDTANSGPSCFELETQLMDAKNPLRELKIEPNPSISTQFCCFAWHRWVASWLQLKFVRFGLSCPKELLVSCCDLAVSISSQIRTDLDNYTYNGHYLPQYNPGLQYFENPAHLLHIIRCCETVLGVAPNSKQSDIHTSYHQFETAAKRAFSSLECNCSLSTFDECINRTGWSLLGYDSTQYRCQRKELWNAAGQAVGFIVLCFLVVADEFVSLGIRDDETPNFVNSALRGASVFTEDYRDAPNGTSCGTLHHEVCRLVRNNNGIDIALSSGMSTITPGLFQSVGWQPSQFPFYKIHDGQLMYENHYYSTLASEPNYAPYGELDNLYKALENMHPTDIGSNTRITLSVRTGLGRLSLMTRARADGQEWQIDLSQHIINSLAIINLDSCGHSPKDAISDESRAHVVIAPLPWREAQEKDTIAIAQNRGDATGRLLCCNYFSIPVFLNGSCINCAITRVRKAQSQRRWIMKEYTDLLYRFVIID